MAQVLRPLIDRFKPADYPALLVGLGAPDDAAVYRIDDTTALIQTIDFFPPVVDDAYAFGAIAAANAMSDVYAMGGQVILGLNISAWRDDLPLETLSEIFRGAADQMERAGAAIAGGHSITDNEPKFGLSVTGRVHPDHIVRKGGAQPGDQLVLTKPLGSGLITTAAKNRVCSPNHLEKAIEWMMQLNRGGAIAMQECGIRSATDITGYGLLGHAYEMADSSKVRFQIHSSALPVMDGALDYARRQQIPGGAGRNKLYLQDRVAFLRQIDDALYEVCYDPQTSGGLLISVAPARVETLLSGLDEQGAAHWIIGEVLPLPAGQTTGQPPLILVD